MVGLFLSQCIRFQFSRFQCDRLHRRAHCHKASAVIMLALGLLLPSAGWCAHLPLVPTMLQAGAVVSSDDYRLDAGDEIGVDDATMGSLAQSGVQIGSDGTVDLPLIGTVSLAGLTVGQA